MLAMASYLVTVLVDFVLVLVIPVVAVVGAVVVVVVAVAVDSHHHDNLHSGTPWMASSLLSIIV